MNPSEVESFLQNQGYAYAGEIIEHHGLLRFEWIGQFRYEQEMGYTYAWVTGQQREAKEIIRYFGVAGGRFHNRCMQHTQGFNEALPTKDWKITKSGRSCTWSTGQRHAARIRKVLRENHYDGSRGFVSVWRRRSEVVSLLGLQNGGSLCFSEKQAFLKHYFPAWNRESKSKEQFDPAAYRQLLDHSQS